MIGFETTTVKFLPIWNQVPVQRTSDEGKLYWDLYLPGDTHATRRFIISPMQNNKTMLVVWVLYGQKEDSAIYNALCNNVEEAKQAADEYGMMYMQAVKDLRTR